MTDRMHTVGQRVSSVRSGDDRRSGGGRRMGEESIKDWMVAALERLARIEQRLDGIDATLDRRYVCCKHVTNEGTCEFKPIVDAHEKTINHWTGAIAGVALVCSLLGSVIGAIIVKMFK